MKQCVQLVIGAMMVFFFSSNVVAEINPPAKGGVLPDFTLKTPQDSEAAKYLGVKGDTFTIPSIQAEIVIIQIFSMYCPHCQREAPVVNQLFDIIEKKYHDQIKLIAIGAGNSDYEVAYFQKKYGTRFPLFSDVDFGLHKIFGEVRTPYFIAIKIEKNGSHRVIYSKLGSFGEPEEFLNQIVKESFGK